MSDRGGEMTELEIIVTIGGFVAAGVGGILSFRAAVGVLLPEELRTEIRRRDEGPSNGRCRRGRCSGALKSPGFRQDGL